MGKLVLIVDDSTFMRQLVSLTLQRAGYEVIEGSNGQEGLEQLSNHRVNLIISDVHMPVMDGTTFVKHVRETVTNGFTPILMLTTESNEARKQEVKAAGATGWIEKPFDPNVLLQTIAKVVR
jgi:two-component system chemotaxis response regulator CheY